MGSVHRPMTRVIPGEYYIVVEQNGRGAPIKFHGLYSSKSSGYTDNIFAQEGLHNTGFPHTRPNKRQSVCERHSFAKSVVSDNKDYVN